MQRLKIKVGLSQPYPESHLSHSIKFANFGILSGSSRNLALHVCQTITEWWEGRFSNRQIFSVHNFYCFVDRYALNTLTRFRMYVISIRKMRLWSLFAQGICRVRVRSSLRIVTCIVASVEPLRFIPSIIRFSEDLKLSTWILLVHDANA